VQEGTVCKCM